LYDLPLDHDLEHLRAAIRLCRSHELAIDGGAHRGIWSREMRRHFKSVVSIEPVEENAKHIEAGVVLLAALGAEPGTARMQAGTENTGQWHHDPEAEQGQEAPIITIDALALAKVSLLKLDVEGMELFALKGAEQTIQDWRPVIVVEMNGLHRRYGTKDGETELWLMQHGYRLAEQLNKDQIWVWQ
jgi:FkbM family methyltransferase